MSLFDLKITGAPKKSDGIVMIKEFSKNPLTRRVVDIQLQRISMKEKIHVAVPVEMTGEPAGLKNGGILELVTTELQISCLPNDIPSKIEIDVSGLDIGDMIRASDLVLGSSIEVLADPETLVCNCLAPHVRAQAEEARSRTRR